MGKRVLFVPFMRPSKQVKSRDRSPGGAYRDKNVRWINQYEWNKQLAVVEGRAWHSVHEHWYDGTINAVIHGLGGDDQIYIRGHSMAGLDCIYDIDVDKEDGHPETYNADKRVVKCVSKAVVTLDAYEVVKRLKCSGLEARFSGHIKCYNCHSADDSDSFAYCLHTALQGEGYKQCRVFGYRGALSSFHNTDGFKTSDSASGGKTAKSVRVDIGEARAVMAAQGRQNDDGSK